VIKEIIEETVLNGAITYDYVNEKSLFTGYAVSIYPKRERSLKSLREKYLIHYIHENYDLLIKEPNCLGIWYHNGYYILDVVQVVFDLGVALEIARENDQIAIYDLDKGREIII